jgi:hypothetical protein
MSTDSTSKNTKMSEEEPSQDWDETATDKFNLPKGKYYIGDLSLVLPGDTWKEISDEPGISTLSDGRIVVCFQFKGCQPEENNNTYFYMESSKIGITLCAGLKKKWDVHSQMFGSWGPHFNQLQELKKSKNITMVDFMKIAGKTVVYKTNFDCQQSTMSHYKNDDHSTSTQFGDNVCVWTIHGTYDSENESEFDGSE